MTERANKLGIVPVLIGAAVGAIGASLFFAVGAAAMNLAIDLLHLSRREGGDAYAMVAVGLLLGIVGFIASVWLALRGRGLRGAKVLLGGLASTALLLVLIGSAFGAWYSMQPHILNPNGPEPMLGLEIRAPESFGAEAMAAIKVELSTDRNGADALLDAPNAATPLTRTGLLPLYYRTSQRLLSVTVPNGPTRVYRLRLPADPRAARYQEWSAWQGPDSIDDGQSATLKRGSNEPDVEIRYQMQRVDE